MYLVMKINAFISKEVFIPIGIDNYIEMARKYEHLGPLYQVPSLIKSMQKEDKTFSKPLPK